MRLAFASLCLAASLACDLSAVGQTITATPNLTPQATRLDSPTPAAQPSESPTATATASGPGQAATLDPNATPSLINPCSLVTTDEAASALGAPVMNGIPAGGGCVYADSVIGRYLLSAYAVPATTTEIITGRVYLLTAYGLQIQSTDVDNLKALGAQGDARGVIESLLSLTKNATGFTAQPIAELGDGAIWVSKNLGSVQQGFLLAARGDALVGIDIVVTSARADSSVRESAVRVVGQMLTRLPLRFIVAIPTLVPTVTPTPTGQPSLTPPTNVPVTPTATRPSETPATLAPSPTAGTVTATVTLTLKPPAFSVPIVSSNQLTYGGQCGLSLAAVTVTVADPSLVSPIAAVALFVRVNDPASGQVTDWTALPMRSDGHSIWLGIINAETALPGHEKFPTAAVEYYFAATNAAGITAESPHYGVQSNVLTLTACATPIP